jgi:hypothetical protein
MSFLNTDTSFLNTEHCLVIAGAFIAIIGACATLLNISNGKADGLANRYRALTEEFRAEIKREHWPASEDSRLTQLHKQIHLFKKRVDMVACAQGSLFVTIFLFIISIAAFIYIGMKIIYLKVPEGIVYEDMVYQVAQLPMTVIEICVLFGVVTMSAAIVFLFIELVKAVQTFRVEAKDCLESGVDGSGDEAEAT